LFVDNSSNSKDFIRALDDLGTLDSSDHSSLVSWKVTEGLLT